MDLLTEGAGEGASRSAPVSVGPVRVLERLRIHNIAIATTEQYAQAIPLGQAEAAEKLGDL